MERLTKIAKACNRELDANEVTKVFEDEINSFQNMYKALVSLRDKSLG